MAVPLLIPAAIGLTGAVWGYMKGSSNSDTPRQPGAIENIVDDMAAIAKWAAIGFVIYLVVQKTKVLK